MVFGAFVGPAEARLGRRGLLAAGAALAALPGCGVLAQRLPVPPRVVGPGHPVLADSELRLRVGGLEPRQRVTVRAWSGNHAWESWATFVADELGWVDLSRRAPVDGTYHGVEPMGLFWSMVETVPNLGGLGEAFELIAEVDGRAVARRVVRRRQDAPDVAVRTLFEGGPVGRFYAPSAVTGPPVVVLGGSNGGLPARHAGLLAAHGFPTLALAYFNYPGRPPTLSGQPLEYFADAFAWLRGQPEARGQRVALLGISRGGELVLLLGATYPDQVGAVVAYVPSSVLWSGVGAGGQAAWRLGDVPLPFMNNFRAATSNDPHRRFLQQMEDAAVVERASIPVERMRCPILLISGTDDGLWPSTMFCERVMARLAQHDHPHPRVHLKYEGAGHNIGPPYVPTTATTAPHPFAGRLFLGGAAKPNADANADSWPKVIEFLRDRPDG